MSRVIKFRVWKESQTYVWGTQSATSSARWLDPTRTLIAGDGTIYDNDGYENCSLMDQREFLTLEQFTGLVDKNGKEIYEGDIVKASLADDDEDITSELSKVVGRIGYRTDTAGYSVSPYLNDTIHRVDISVLFLRCGASERLEIIGNIHENPNLLKP